MKKIYLLIFTGFLCALQTNAQCVSNLLNNADFETPVQPSIGNNLTGLYTLSGGWNVTGGPFNIIKTNGSVYGGGPNNAKSGTQYVEITNSGGTIYQDFNVATSGTTIEFGGFFSSRELSGSYVNWIASIDIISLPTLNVVATSSTRNFTNADGGSAGQEIWHFLPGITTLAAGNYRYVVNLGDFGNFDSAFVNPNCILPLQLQSFTGAVVNNAVNLNWKVSSAINFSHFEIEKSNNGINFSKLGNVVFQNRDQYQFNDGAIVYNNHYFYRLKMVDFDGNFSYSNVLHFQGKTLAGMALLGNPVKNTLLITGLQTSGQISIFDMTGKLVKQKMVRSVKEILEVSSLRNGLYILKYNNGQSIETQKFIKE